MAEQPMPPSSTLCTCANPRHIESPTYRLPDYLYVRLSEKSSFRIFTLSPGLEAEPIRGTLREISLTENDPDDNFNALSYTWSGASPIPERTSAPTEQAKTFAWETVQKPHTIVVDEVSKMAVTCSVLSALLRLRSTSSEVRIFVDAICIDQGSSTESLNERASQVRWMGDIYRKAHTVFVDLGDQDDGAVDVLDQIREFSMLDDAVWGQALTSADEFLRLFPQTLLIGMTRKSWHALIALCARRWWKRIWIVQEVLLAAQALVFVNRETIDRDVLTKSLHRIWDCWMLYQYFFGVHGLEMPDREMACQINQHCAHPCQNLSSFLSWKRTRPDFFSDFRLFDLVWIIATTPVLESAIPHDQIYALLGLVCDEDSGAIPVDYSLPYEAVLVSFSAFVIRSGFLHTLLHLTSAQNTDCPTWVLDPMTRNAFDSLDNSVYFVPTSTIFHASGCETAKASFDETGMLCSVEGVLCGTLDVMTESYSPSWEDVTWENFCEWCLNARTLYTSHKVETASSTIGDFWTTICLGRRIPAHGIDLSKLAENAHAFDANLGSSAMAATDEVLQFYYYASAICLGRRFSMTLEGSPALVSDRAQPGDKVAVFLGCPIPFVIRPTTRGTYRFVGSAYVHGFMDGEALQSEQTYRETIVLE